MKSDHEHNVLFLTSFIVFRCAVLLGWLVILLETSVVSIRGDRVATGEQLVYFIKEDGTLWKWGWGGGVIGPLIDALSWEEFYPQQIGQDKDWKSVASGYRHHLALKENGTLWGWGANAIGQLGIGNVGDQSEPVQITTDTDWTSVHAGILHSMALKKDGSLWAWGGNSHGQLGDSTNETRWMPVKISEADHWVSLSVSDYHSLAVRHDGTLWAWGPNGNGQLGDGTTDSKNKLTQIGNDTDWASASAGSSHSLAIKKNGSLWSWGGNFYGQLGDGNFNEGRTEPVQVGIDTDWASVSASSHSFGLKQDGSCWAWGSNQPGNLGDGTRTNRNIPTLIENVPEWSQVFAGWGISVGLTSDLDFWFWGIKVLEFGDDNTVHQLVPRFMFSLAELVSISPISDKVIMPGQSVSLVPFSMGGDNSAGNGLVVWVESSNHGIVPPDKITISRNGSEGVLTIHPVNDAIGYTTISVLTFHGSFVIRSSFQLTVKEFVSVDGRILFYGKTNRPLQSVEVVLSRGGQTQSTFTDRYGAYQFNVLLGVPFDISVNMLNLAMPNKGVDVEDLVNLRKHILNRQRLDTSGHWIAADVNRDGEIDVSDIVQMRKVILNRESAFSRDEYGNYHSDWRILTRGFASVAPENAFRDVGTYEGYHFEDVTVDITGVDFIAIKLGDSNGDWASGVDIQP